MHHSFKQSCLFVCGNAEQNIKPDGLLIKQVVLCSVEQSNRGKIAFRQMYLNLLNVLQHCENWSGIGKEGCVYVCVCMHVCTCLDEKIIGRKIMAWSITGKKSYILTECTKKSQ